MSLYSKLSKQKLLGILSYIISYSKEEAPAAVFDIQIASPRPDQYAGMVKLVKLTSSLADNDYREDVVQILELLGNIHDNMLLGRVKFIILGFTGTKPLLCIENIQESKPCAAFIDIGRLRECINQEIRNSSICRFLKPLNFILTGMLCLAGAYVYKIYKNY